MRQSATLHTGASVTHGTGTSPLPHPTDMSVLDPRFTRGCGGGCGYMGVWRVGCVCGVWWGGVGGGQVDAGYKPFHCNNKSYVCLACVHTAILPPALWCLSYPSNSVLVTDISTLDVVIGYILEVRIKCAPHNNE